MDYLTEIYEKMGSSLDPSESYFCSDSRFMALEEALLAIPKGNFCDLGCGRGALIRRLGKYHRVFGTDFDPAVVQFCRSSGLAVERIDLNEARELPFGDIKFDVIVISEVCEHLLAPRNAFRLAKNALRPNGTLIVTVPNALPLFARLRSFFGRSVGWLHYPSPETEFTGHIRFYTLESMSRLLGEEGFSVEHTRGVSFRMNGRFWGRLCFWLPRLFGNRSEYAPARLDMRLGRMMPGLSPGLFFVCKVATTPSECI